MTHYDLQELALSTRGTLPKNRNAGTSENNHYISLRYIVSLFKAMELAHLSWGCFMLVHVGSLIIVHFSFILALLVDADLVPRAAYQGQRAKQLPEDPEMLVTGEEVASALSGDSTAPVGACPSQSL